MKRYTVLLLRPDYMWDGSQADWVYRADVMAHDPSEAVVEAQRHAVESDGYDDVPVDDYAPLAVFEGHCVDVLGCVSFLVSKRGRLLETSLNGLSATWSRPSVCCHC